ncbi:MAG TPA: hypothetical protein ENO28_11740 [Bacteroidetes bacterium]|nr:hypothetical protein [Bacteroidota bacterium]
MAASIKAQPPVKIAAGVIYLNDGTSAPNEKKYAPFIDSLERNLKSNPNDTTGLFYRSLLYLRFNSVVAIPDLSNSQAANKLLLARRMADRADSLRMQSFNLKVLRAQIAKELTNRYAPMDLWRFTEKQIAERKKKFEYFKGLANAYYDKLALIDKDNAYDYQRLKVK